ncbi:hypothetical protein [Salinibacillus xinjiangensis]|uniref:Uncharacterized protein n=1 Tax=Salinibacillus xinjiangensis TaxID=1229268 RepID=A0A6G1X543_9BACI|nr:hypothetical protein [Salinibacillus xinjiangensis]MRG86084.1 hypothetical protein [Salinibacillus xinjiangensis]
MKKKRIWVPIVLVILFILLHLSPKLALRTHVVFMGHPVAAVTSELIQDNYHNETDKNQLKKLDAKVYTLTEPPIEEATQSELRNFIVKEVGFLYFAEYYGEV